MKMINKKLVGKIYEFFDLKYKQIFHHSLNYNK